MQGNFNRLAEIENIPDLQSLYLEVNDPFKRLLKIRNKSSSKKFRAWLGDCSSSSDSLDIAKDYIDLIANSKGFFETKKGKFVKTIVMSAIGAGVGALIAGHTGAVGGVGVSRILEPTADIGLDMLDEFVLSGLTKGWTPKLFFDDIEKIKKSNQEMSSSTNTSTD